jgi:hypothetical protein
VHTECLSKHIRVKFKNCLDEVEGVITFFKKTDNERSLARTPTLEYCFKLSNTEKTEMALDFYDVDTIAYL